MILSSLVLAEPAVAPAPLLTPLVAVSAPLAPPDLPVKDPLLLPSVMLIFRARSLGSGLVSSLGFMVLPGDDCAVLDVKLRF